jgi:nucleoside-triphosphatase
MTPRRILLEGPPRVGKTTLTRRVIELLQQADVQLGGFTSRELLERGRRVGFAIEAIDGAGATMAHVDYDRGPRVGRYRVDVAAVERIAIPAMARARGRGGVVILDELGRMELASDAFVAALDELFDDDLPVLATIQAHTHPITDAIKARTDVQRVQVTPHNRAQLAPTLAPELIIAAQAPRRPRSS